MNGKVVGGAGENVDKKAEAQHRRNEEFDDDLETLGLEPSGVISGRTGGLLRKMGVTVAGGSAPNRSIFVQDGSGKTKDVISNYTIDHSKKDDVQVTLTAGEVAYLLLTPLAVILGVGGVGIWGLCRINGVSSGEDFFAQWRWIQGSGIQPGSVEKK